MYIAYLQLSPAASVMYIQDALTLSLHLWPLQKASPAITHIRPVIRLRHLAPRLPRVHATGQDPPLALLGRAQTISVARLLGVHLDSGDKEDEVHR